MTTIEIPLRDTDEVIELDTDAFPDVDEVLNILKQEIAPMHVWIAVALQYYRSKKDVDFVKVLNEANIHASLSYGDSEKDQVKVLDMLANYYVKQATKEKTKEKKKELFSQAAQHFTTADRIAMLDHNHLLSRAFFFLFEGENWSQVDNQLNFVLNASPNNVAALLGKGCIAFNKKEYRQALSFYRKALKIHPNCPASVRLGMGHCFFRLNNFEKAKLAFERALALDSDCVGALVGLAVLELNEKTLESVHEGVKKLSHAYMKDNNHPMVLNQLADHFFYAGQYSKVHTLALHAYHLTENELMRAQSCYQIARRFHKEEKYDEAFQYYYQATQFASNNYVMPFYGLGQMYLYRKDIENAIASFEKVLKVYPSNYETLKILGSLYAQSDKDDRKELGKKMFQKVTEIEPEDLEAWIEYAQLLRNDPSASLEAYLKAIEFLKSEKMDVPPEILNNVGVLYHLREAHDEAMKFYKEALERIDVAKTDITNNPDSKQDDVNYYVGMSVTINYNQARLFEAQYRHDEADILYKKILKQFPEYLDCLLRLGCMARDRGLIYDASDWFKEALKFNQEHPESWSLMGLLHLGKNEAGPAQKKFEFIIRQNPNDIFVNVALGNIWLNTLHHPSKDKEKEKRHQDRALTHFRNVLRLDTRNILAAHGIGAVLAHKGDINEARDVFVDVREATADFPDVWINIAHIYVEQKQYLAAIQMYENCIKKFGKQTNTEILLYLARAHFKCDQLKKCKQVLLKARHIAPWDPLIAYNLAFVQKRWALSVVPDEKSPFSAVLEGVNDLNMAQCTFNYLASLNDQINIPQLPSEMRDCQDLLSQVRYYIDRAKAREQQERFMRQKQAEEREQLRKSQLTRQQQEESLRQEKEKKLEEDRNKFMEKGVKIIMENKQELAQKKSKGGQKRIKSGAIGEEFIQDGASGSSDGEAEAAGGRGTEGGEPVRKKPRREGGGGSGGKKRQRLSGKGDEGRAKVISKATVSDSDESAGSDDDSRMEMPSTSQSQKPRLVNLKKENESDSASSISSNISGPKKSAEGRPSAAKETKRKRNKTDSNSSGVANKAKRMKNKLLNSDSDSDSQNEEEALRKGMMKDSSSDEEITPAMTAPGGNSQPAESRALPTSFANESSSSSSSSGDEGPAAPTATVAPSSSANVAAAMETGGKSGAKMMMSSEDEEDEDHNKRLRLMTANESDSD